MISTADKDSFRFLFPNMYVFVDFSCLFALAETSVTTGENLVRVIPCLSPSLRGKAFSLLPLISCSLFVNTFYLAEKFLSILRLLNFYCKCIKICQTFIFTSTNIIMFLYYCVNMIYIN